VPNIVVDIAQIISALGTLTAVVIALYVADKSRREVQTDRRLQVQPVIIFQQGGHLLPIKKRSFGHRIPGCNHSAVESAFKDVSADSQIILNDKPYGHAVNIGSGPAIGVQVEFKPLLIKLGQEHFTIDGKRRSEPRYFSPFNTMPLASVMAPNETASLPRLPTFIVLDIDERITYAEGELIIRYGDISGEASKTRQLFRYFNESSVPKDRQYCMTFADIVSIPLFTGRR
jgi:hypothetical protein